jgi:uncharacterized OB-fold protein
MSEPFWAATREGRLVIQRCTTCGTYVWTPQMACRQCRTETLEWTDVAGLGTVYTYVVLHRSAIPAIDAPYVIAVVELDEGARLLTNIIGVDPGEVRIGMRVEVAFEDAGSVSLPFFRPVTTATT